MTSIAAAWARSTRAVSARYTTRTLATETFTSGSSSSAVKLSPPAPERPGKLPHRRQDDQAVHRDSKSVYVRAWDAISTMPEFFAILRGVEKRFGTVKEFRVARDHDVTSMYLNHFILEFADDASFERITTAGSNIKVEVPVVNAATPGGIGLGDLAGLLEPQEFDPELQDNKQGIYGAPVSVFPPDHPGGKTRMVEVVVQRAKRDASSLPRTRPLYHHAHFGSAFYDWGGFYTRQPGSDDRPVPPLMTAAVDKWRSFALENPRRAAREKEAELNQDALNLTQEEVEKAQAERRKENEERTQEREREIGEMLVKGAEAGAVTPVQKDSVPAAVNATDKPATTTRLSSRREKILERARRNARIPVQELSAENIDYRQEEVVQRKGEDAKEVATLRERLLRLMGGKW